MVGDVLAERYELEEVVGSGGMSSVYRAHDSVLDRRVALKVLHQRLVGEEEYIERFRREARMVAGLVHHNIVTVIDRGEDDGCPFIVFEFVDGENLKQLIEREGPLPIDRALELGIQVANGLAFAHANGFVHRDVKPQNVLLNGNGEAKVTDFGIARSLDVEHGMTQTGTVLGTSDYIAPEQAQGKQVDEHTDMYSLGVVLYELLTGRLPFGGESFVAVAMQHINDPPAPISSLRADVPPRVDAAVMKALAKEPEDRFATMAELASELEACLQELRSPAGSETVVLAPPQRVRRTHARRRPPVWALLLALGLAIAVAALTIALVRESGSSGSPNTGSSGGTAVALQGVASYDPYGDGREHPERVRFATDGNTSTYWETEHYNTFTKQGVGVVLDAGSTRTLRHMTVTTDTAGFTALIEGGNSEQGGFQPVSAAQTVSGQVTYDLQDAKYRYFVVWITRVPPSGVAHVNEVDASS